MLHKIIPILFLLLLSGKETLSQNSCVLPESVKATLKQEYTASYKIATCVVEDMHRYRISVRITPDTIQNILIEETGKWLRKSTFIGMTESDIAILMKVQELTDNVEKIKVWNRVLFPDGRIEFRVVIDNKLYAWGADKTYLGRVKDAGLAATPNNIIHD